MGLKTLTKNHQYYDVDDCGQNENINHCASGMSEIAIREKINGTGWDGTGQNEIER
jgi:hypothetical protein